MRTTVLAHHYNLILRPLEQVIVKQKENWDLDYLSSEQKKGRKGREHKREVTLICPWSKGNLVEEPEVRSKFLGYSHSHYVANEDENDNNELNSDFKT